jgi:hypothetical protein
MEHAIADMEGRRYEAMRQADVAVLREVLDDLLVYAHSNSAADDKESYLAKVQAGYFGAFGRGASSRTYEGAWIAQRFAVDSG